MRNSSPTAARRRALHRSADDDSRRKRRRNASRLRRCTGPTRLKVRGLLGRLAGKARRCGFCRSAVGGAGTQSLPTRTHSRSDPDVAACHPQAHPTDVIPVSQLSGKPLEAFAAASPIDHDAQPGVRWSARRCRCAQTTWGGPEGPPASNRSGPRSALEIRSACAYRLPSTFRPPVSLPPGFVRHDRTLPIAVFRWLASASFCGARPLRVQISAGRKGSPPHESPAGAGDLKVDDPFSAA